MNKPQSVDQHLTLNPSVVKTEESPPELTPYTVSSSENSATSFDDNDVIEFGPIKVKPRKKPAPTLATGRRSKYEILTPEEEHKRDVRRARNRAAAERVRISRLNVEQDLQGQINSLEEQEQQLINNVQMLQHQKLHLQTRLFTHERMCPSVNVLNSTINNQIPAFSSNNISTSTMSQLVNNVNEFNIDDLFSDSSSPIQTQQNDFPTSFTTMIPDGDNLDLFMDS